VARTGGLPIALMFSLPNGGAWIPDGMILFSMPDTFFRVCVRRKPGNGISGAEWYSPSALVPAGVFYLPDVVGAEGWVAALRRTRCPAVTSRKAGVTVVRRDRFRLALKPKLRGSRLYPRLHFEVDLPGRDIDQRRIVRRPRGHPTPSR